jgi:hypothetical protein
MLGETRLPNPLPPKEAVGLIVWFDDSVQAGWRIDLTDAIQTHIEENAMKQFRINSSRNDNRRETSVA